MISSAFNEPGPHFVLHYQKIATIKMTVHLFSTFLVYMISEPGRIAGGAFPIKLAKNGRLGIFARQAYKQIHIYPLLPVKRYFQTIAG